MGTIGTIFSMQGVNKQGHATTDKFYDANEVPPLFDKSSADVLVLGAGGHANVIISLLRETGHGIAGVYDDDPSIVGTEIMGVKVRGRIVDLQTNSNAQAIIAVGSPYVRQALANKYAFDWITLVHPMSWVDPSSQIGPGSVVMAGAVVQASCRLGKHVIVNTCASVDHECVLADFAHICPGGRLAGAVTIGERSTLGTGAIAIPGVEIGADTTIGAGAVVTRSIPPGVTAVGQPARITVENLKLTQVA